MSDDNGRQLYCADCDIYFRDPRLLLHHTTSFEHCKQVLENRENLGPFVPMMEEERGDQKLKALKKEMLDLADKLDKERLRR